MSSQSEGSPSHFSDRHPCVFIFQDGHRPLAKELGLRKDHISVFTADVELPKSPESGEESIFFHHDGLVIDAETMSGGQICFRERCAREVAGRFVFEITDPEMGSIGMALLLGTGTPLEPVPCSEDEWWEYTGGTRGTSQ